MRPRLLDLFCCEGGAAMGYMAAGFDVVGVDRVSRFARRYPGTFWLEDALDLLADDTLMRDFDAIHASPPCQGYSRATAGNQAARDKHQRLIPAVRDLLEATGKPYIIENVDQARSEMHAPLTLCGTMFGLRATDDDGTLLEMWRHRLFESNLDLSAPAPCQHGWYSHQVAGSYGGARRDKVEARTVRKGGYVPSVLVQQRLLGIDWMTQHGLYQSLPPVYTLHLGRQVLDVVRAGP